MEEVAIAAALLVFPISNIWDKVEEYRNPEIVLIRLELEIKGARGGKGKGRR